MRKLLKHGLLAVAVAGGLALTPGTASADVYNDFRIDATVGGDDAVCNTISNPAPAEACIGDRIDFSYLERFTVTGPGTFSTDAYADVTAFLTNEATELLLQTGLNDDYAIYALFSATGNFAPNASGGFDFTATGGSLTLVLDNNVDTGKTLPGSSPGAVVLTNAGDDLVLANAVLESGEGHTDPSDPDSGDFEIVFDPFALTAIGSTFFVAPVPFYTELLLRGVFDAFDPVLRPNLITGGSGNAQFLPEPTSLALFGLGLLGSGYMARRRRTAK